MQEMPSCPTPSSDLSSSCHHPRSWPAGIPEPHIRASVSTPETLVLKSSPILPPCLGTELEKFLSPWGQGGAGGKPGQSSPATECRGHGAAGHHRVKGPSGRRPLTLPSPRRTPPHTDTLSQHNGPSPPLPPGPQRAGPGQKDPDRGQRPPPTPPQSPEAPILPLRPHPLSLPLRGLRAPRQERGAGKQLLPPARKRPRAATQGLQSDSRRDFPLGLPHPQPPTPSSCFLQHKDHTGHTLPVARPARHLPPPAPTWPVPQCLSPSSPHPGAGWALTVGVRASGAAAGTPRPAGGP